jgi:hypothetical protein
MRTFRNRAIFFTTISVAVFLSMSASFANHCSQESNQRLREMDTTWAAALKRADQLDAARLPMKDTTLCKALMRNIVSVEAIVRHLQERPSCFHDSGSRNEALRKMNELLRTRRSIVPKAC